MNLIRKIQIISVMKNQNLSQLLQYSVLYQVASASLDTVIIICLSYQQAAVCPIIGAERIEISCHVWAGIFNHESNYSEYSMLYIM